MQYLRDILKNLAAEERKLNVQILRHLQTVEEDKCYLDWGFSSLFAYLTEELCYAESSAYRRISAMRLLRQEESIAEKLELGSLSLSNAAQVQSTLRLLKLKSPEVRKNLIEVVENKSTREAERILLQTAQKLEPSFVMPAQEKLRPRMDGSLEMQITISAELEAKLRKLKELYSHKNPAMSYAELLEILANKALQEAEPKKSLPASEVMSKNPRYISVNNRRAVYRRDQSCTYLDPRTGRRCNSRILLEIDHKIPVSLGGDSRLSNLRLLCRAHNHRAAEDLGILRTYRKSNASELLETHENLSGISTNSELGGSPQKFYGDNGSTGSL